MFLFDFLFKAFCPKFVFWAFSSAVQGRTVWGDKRVHYGTFTNTGGSTGGDIASGLAVVEGCMLSFFSAATVSSDAGINESFPLKSPNITIVTIADADGYWVAWGR